MKKLFAICISYLICLTSCLPKRTNPERIWFFIDSKYLSEAYLDISPASFLNLESGGTYTRDFGKFDYGRWELKEGTLFLTSKLTNASAYPVKFPSGTELQLKTPEETILNFEGKFVSPTTGSPFSLQNNQWRIPARQKETDEEIRSRLRNHCSFYENYFRWALDNGITQLDVRSTASLIKIYGNGFTLKPLKELPPAWKAIFFDEEDCEKANKMIKDIFERHDIAWANTDNKFKMFASAFQQLQQLLK
jgi:hypothetical protein